MPVAFPLYLGSLGRETSFFHPVYSWAHASDHQPGGQEEGWLDSKGRWVRLGRVPVRWWEHRSRCSISEPVPRRANVLSAPASPVSNSV